MRDLIRRLFDFLASFVYAFIELMSEFVSTVIDLISGTTLGADEIRNLAEEIVAAQLSILVPVRPFPKPAADRVREAHEHLKQADQIVHQLREDLDNRMEQLDQLEKLAQQYQADAEHYERLAQVNQEAAQTVHREIVSGIEETVQFALEEDRRRRRKATIIAFAVTILSSAIAGHYVSIWLQ